MPVILSAVVQHQQVIRQPAQAQPMRGAAGSSMTRAACTAGADRRRTTVTASVATPSTISTPIAITTVTIAFMHLASPAASRAMSSVMSDLPNGGWSVTAGPMDAGVRLDRFLAQRIGTMSRSRLKSLIEDGHARTEDIVTTDPAAPVHAGVAVCVVQPAAAGGRPGRSRRPFR